jgi:hypothetical protein
LSPSHPHLKNYRLRVGGGDGEEEGEYMDGGGEGECEDEVGMKEGYMGMGSMGMKVGNTMGKGDTG